MLSLSQCRDHIAGRQQAVEMGQALIERHFGHDVKKNERFKDDASAIYRLLDDDDSDALNAGTMSKCEPRSGAYE